MAENGTRRKRSRSSRRRRTGGAVPEPAVNKEGSELPRAASEARTHGVDIHELVAHVEELDFLNDLPWTQNHVPSQPSKKSWDLKA